MTDKNNEDHDDLAMPHPAPRRRYRRQADGVIIERVETTGMTPEQYSSAVTTLAALIERWQQHRYSQTDPRDTAA
jgi:hypothetical protein